MDKATPSIAKSLYLGILLSFWDQGAVHQFSGFRVRYKNQHLDVSCNGCLFHDHIYSTHEKSKKDIEVITPSFSPLFQKLSS